MQIKILDTGYVSNTTAIASQTQLSVANRAGYDGSTNVGAFTLNTSSLVLSGNARTENKPEINTLTDVETTSVSVVNRNVEVTTILQKEIVTANFNQNNVVELSRLERTRGVKLLYPTVTTDTKKTIVEALGAVNTGGNFSAESPTDTNGTVGTTIPYLVGRVKNFRITDNPAGDKWRVTFNFEITG
jgi:hypothetical protein